MHLLHSPSPEVRAEAKKMGKLIGETQSLCPVCLRRIPAKRIAENGSIYLDKNCPEHGYYRTLIWSRAESYEEWGRFGIDLGSPKRHITNFKKGCPYDCGLCPNHKAQTCFAILELTHRCNLKCPICFASSPQYGYDPSLDVIKGMYETVLNHAGRPPIQLSGGEPTIRDDLPQIARMGKEMGFEYIQVDTNGIRIAQDIEFLQELKNNGVSNIYLQFDGLTDDVYRLIRGKALLDIKVQAIKNCREVKIGVVLVPTLIPRINDKQIGDIVSFAKEWIPTVKGVHFQPVSYFGRYPNQPRDADRITIPDVLCSLEDQTKGEVKERDFVPRRRKESYCAFGGLFVLDENDRLVPVTNYKNAQDMVGGMGQMSEEPYKKVRSFISEKWRVIEDEEGVREVKPGSWDSFFKRARTHSLSISCMPFQDVWNIDLERLQRCCTHIVTYDKKIIPLCSFYCTSVDGRRFHENVS